MIVVEAKVINTASGNLERLAKVLPKEFDKSLKSAGWWLKTEIQKGIAEGSPGGQRYSAFTNVFLSRKRKAKWLTNPADGKKYIQGSIAKKKHSPLGRLKQATRYIWNPASHTVVLGWVSNSAEQIGTMHEMGGKTYQVTDKMRRFFWASGMPISASKKSIFIPKRPTIAPEFRENKDKVAPYIEEKIFKIIGGGGK